MNTPTAASWSDCVGAAKWIAEPLKATLSYATPLPVQLAVIPTVARALLSGIPMDVSLTAPTGSGKTLCYLLPMLQLVTAEKKGLNDTRLRAIVLVPTKALGQQVFRELTRLTRHTTIAVESLCADAESMVREAEMLVRRVPLLGASAPLRHWESDTADVSPPASTDGADALFGVPLPRAGADKKDDDDEDGAEEEGEGGFGSGSGSAISQGFHYFSKVDILVATPQRLLRHLDSTAGFSLAALRLLVIDEADQVLAGNFANFVVKVVERFEEEQGLRLAREQATRRRLQGQLGHAGPVQDTSSHAHPSAQLSAPSRDDQSTSPGGSHTLHKMLCSATLSSRIGRISEVRLRNCQYFALTTEGTAVPSPQQQTITLSSSATAAGRGGRGKKGGAAAAAAATTASTTVVSTDFALPPTLREHIVFVEDSYRHAVLLKLVRTLLERIAERERARRRALAEQREKEEEAEKEELEEDARRDGPPDAHPTAEDSAAAAAVVAAPSHQGRRAGGRHPHGAVVAPEAYPAVDDDAGTGILIFCSSAEEARVMGHFLTAAGVRGVIEFTTLTTESERRRALLQHHTHSASSSLSLPNIVVASDALMRGIDIPNTGHVIMYHPPESISQYVHRAGRTARAMRSGHLHVLLSKLGRSGTQADGEVAAFKKLSGLVARTQPQVYERHFFLFSKPPAAVAHGAAAAATPAEGKDSARKKVSAAAAPNPLSSASGSTLAARTEEEEEERRPTTTAGHSLTSPHHAEDDVLATTAGAQEVAAAAAVNPTAYAEWWVEEANTYLAKSQQQLNVRWASALEAAIEAGTQAAAPDNSAPAHGSAGARAEGGHKRDVGKKRQRSTSPAE